MMREKKKSVVKSALSVTLITFGIKLLGLIKQTVLAAYCGANIETDAFFVATGLIANMCTVMFSSISVSLLSIHTDTLIHDGRNDSNKIINGVLRIFSPISVIIAVFFCFGSKYVAKFMAPSYSRAELVTLSNYIKMMSALIVMWCYFTTINVILETDKEFFPGKLQGLFQNSFLIFSAIVLYPRYGVASLIYAFLLSGLVQCILVTFCVRSRFRFLLGSIGKRREIKQLLRLMVPLLVGNAIYEINDIVDKQISTGLGAGNASYLTYGSTINEIVTGVIIASVSTVLFAHFASWIVSGKVTKVEENLKKTIKYLYVIILPIMVMCLFAGDHIIGILYGRGSFGTEEIMSTYGVAAGYATGFIFQAIRANVVKVYYAFQDTKIPMINGAIAVALNIILSFLLSKFIGIGGISLATSISMFVVTVLLMNKLKLYLPNFSLRELIPETIKGAIAFVIASICVLLIKDMGRSILLSFLIEGTACVIVYILVLLFLKSECLCEIVDIFSHRKKKG